MNEVKLTARMGKDADVRTFGDNTVAKFSIAIDRLSKNDADKVSAWLPCEMWRNGECEKFSVLKKGALLDIKGFLKPEVWKDASGNEKSRIVLSVTEAVLKEKKNKDGKQ